MKTTDDHTKRPHGRRGEGHLADEFISSLSSPDASVRAHALTVLLSLPSGNPRYLPHIEALLTDCTPTLLGLPFIFGEVRTLAAEVLAEERALQNILEPIRLAAVPKPLRSDKLGELARESGILRGPGPGLEGDIETYRKVRDAGRIPTRDIYLDPAYLIELRSR